MTPIRFLYYYFLRALAGPEELRGAGRAGAAHPPRRCCTYSTLRETEPGERGGEWEVERPL